MNKNKIATSALFAIALFLLACPLTSSIKAAMPDETGSGVAGTVKFQGTPPKGLRIDMSADPNCAKAHSAPVTTQDIEVNAAGEIENVVVYVADGLGEKTF